jgi:hypothetical protein
MNAFIKTTAGLHKIYRSGNDWKIIFPDGSERWRSVWPDHAKASLVQALRLIPNADHLDLQIVDLYKQS